MISKVCLARKVHLDYQGRKVLPGSLARLVLLASGAQAAFLDCLVPLDK